VQPRWNADEATARRSLAIMQGLWRNDREILGKVDSFVASSPQQSRGQGTRLSL
jgi:hypothetical protein